MDIIAGFQSIIDAHGYVLAVADSATTAGFDVEAAAVARRDTENAIHIDVIEAFPMPEHVLGVLDEIVDGGSANPPLRAGETAVIVRLAHGTSADAGALVGRLAVQRGGAMWVTER